MVNQSNKIRDLEIALGVVACIVLILSFFLYQNKLELNEANDLIDSKDNKIVNLEQKLSQLQEGYDDLNSKYDALSGEKQDLETKYESTKSTISTTINDLNNFETRIRESMAWFSVNNNIGDYYEFRTIQRDLENKCVEEKRDSCNIILSCLPFISDYKKKIVYKSDEETSGTVDYLQSLLSTKENSGGDCEDLSLLFVAEYNHLVDYCIEEGYSRDQITAEGYIPADSGKHWVEKTHNWFYKDAEDVHLGKGYNYAYVVCGTFPYYNNGDEFVEGGGHCAVSIGNRELTDSEDVFDFLSSSHIVESQTGEVFTSEDDFIIWVPEDGSDMSWYDNYLWTVILKDDIVSYDDLESNKWVSYADFLDNSKSMKKGLQELGE